MKIKIYTTPECFYCRAAKQFFKDNNVEFEEIDVSKDEKLAKEAIEKSGQMSVPIIDVDGKIVVGFNEEKLKQIINIDKGKW